ncbi:MAG: hypothetical protein R6U69_04490, partial [Marinobacter sp.]
KLAYKVSNKGGFDQGHITKTNHHAIRSISFIYALEAGNERTGHTVGGRLVIYQLHLLSIKRSRYLLSLMPHYYDHSGDP